ncbi:hypothetical protein KIH41_03470 [Litoribacter ruber]|uniref:Uncharacterized protein n=1 Tax=Litoribacter ruber TaxID=702568 RepID=A0AAP2G5G1_9BACT|nr:MULTISPECIES: hypothetical protein [Litoribacter]MBS9524498.1 hypothetical protein [Litoribacter alkaliphilus]MBT0810332.1 hypothetical protein [Litoribacter ruber]
MSITLRNVIGIIAGIVIGSLVNMGIIMISGYIIPPPEGADVTTREGLQNSIHLFEARHFFMPFLAHALGTFVGAFVAAYMAVSHKQKMAMFVGVFFLLGGIISAVLIPAPMWFILADLFLAYLPMAYLAGALNRTQVPVV